ncbi:putative cytidine deaminase [Saccoglossus kowalevskii]
MESTEEFKTLINECNRVKETAYCPYSKFRVGCAVLTEDGKVYAGSNIENASYGLTICAERAALAKAITEGHRKFKAMALTTDLNEFTTPCGACRQFIVEFGKYDLYMVKPDLSYEKYKYDLLPMGFGPSDLAAERVGQ